MDHMILISVLGYTSLDLHAFDVPGSVFHRLDYMGVVIEAYVVSAFWEIFFMMLIDTIIEAN